MKLLVLVALATVATALPEMFMGRRRGGFTSHQRENKNVNVNLATDDQIGDANITQKLDHFDSSKSKTWPQRYFFNHKYSKEGSAVNLIYLTGEQTDDADFVVNNDAHSYLYYAQQLGADIYSLEHRYYGRSQPTEDTSVANLKYLSSRQAIEDVAEFIRQINTQKGGNQQWIIVGGSYAGALSAWARLKHPELIAGSLASSAPVLAQMDFYGYLQTVDEDFKKYGGLCYDQMKAGFESAQKLLQSEEGRAKLTTIFKITPPLSAYDVLSDYDIFTFYSYLTSPFEDSAQYSNPPIDTLCKQFTANGAKYDPLQAFADIQPPKLVFDVNFTATVEDMRGEEYKGDISDRLWTYQTCTEFGYFQSTNRDTNVFGQAQTSNAYIEWCVQLFGISVDQIKQSVDETNQYYGERDYYAGTNVVFSHGTQDPWSFLAKTSDPKHWSVVIVEVEGGSHCEDIHQSCFIAGHKCTDNMKQIQTLTLENMSRWLNPVFPVPDRVEITDNVGKRPQFFDPKVAPALPVTANFPGAANLRAKRSIEDFAERLEPKIWNKFTGLHGRNGHRHPPSKADLQPEESTVEKAYFVQTWDHFNPNEERTFLQKWYSNPKFGSTNGPNFLMIGEEGPESDYWVSNEALAWMTYAKAVGANVFLLEHRYYGESKLGTTDLQYLTSAQMLYDVATFIRTQQANKSLTGPWITFGGSYPGALSAWSREWFPELILGAVASSAPVQAKTDYYEYLEVVEDVIRRQSQRCYDRTAEAFATLHKLVQDPEGRATIQEKFNLLPAWTSDPNHTLDPLDINVVFDILFAMYYGPVQYNKVDWSDVAHLCSIMEDDKYTDALDALSALRAEHYGDNAIPSSYDIDIQLIIKMKNAVDGHDPKINDDLIADVLYAWQTCNELGYYKATDYGSGMFGTAVPLNFFVTMCERVFGLGMDHVEKAMARTNYQYGGRTRYNATNVVLPNGDADPWHRLGILENNGKMDQSVVPIVIKGTSHCADMYSDKTDDPPVLTQARKTILENIQKWLTADTQGTTPIVVPTTTSPASSSSFLPMAVFAAIIAYYL